MPKAPNVDGRPNRFEPFPHGDSAPAARFQGPGPRAGGAAPSAASQQTLLVELMRLGHAKLSERMRLLRAEGSPTSRAPGADDHFNHLFQGAMRDLEAFLLKEPRTDEHVARWIESKFPLGMRERRGGPSPAPSQPTAPMPGGSQASPTPRSASLAVDDAYDGGTNTLALSGLRPTVALRTASYTYGVPSLPLPQSLSPGRGAPGALVASPVRRSDSSGGSHLLSVPSSAPSGTERLDGQPVTLSLDRLLRHLGLDEARWQEPACAALRARLEAFSEPYRLSYRQAFRGLMVPLQNFDERVMFLSSLGNRNPSEVTTMGRALSTWLQDLEQIPPESRLGALQMALAAFTGVPSLERISVAHAAGLQNVKGLTPQDYPRAIMTLHDVRPQDRLEVALLSAQLCRETFDVESLCTVVEALKDLESPRRMDIAEAVKLFMVRGSSGAMIARMLKAVASVPPNGLAEFADLMLEVRGAMLREINKSFSASAPMLPRYFTTSAPQRGTPLQSQRTDTLITCTVQACELLTSFDGDLQIDLVALMPRLLPMCADEEELIDWMKWLAPKPKQSWEKCLSRFPKLQKAWGNALSLEQKLQFFDGEILKMEDQQYRNYMRVFGQIDRPARSCGDRVALLVALTRVKGPDMPTFIYTINSLDDPALVSGEAFQRLVDAICTRPGTWEGLLDAYDDLSKRFHGSELASKVLEWVSALPGAAQSAPAQLQGEPPSSP